MRQVMLGNAEDAASTSESRAFPSVAARAGNGLCCGRRMAPGVGRRRRGALGILGALEKVDGRTHAPRKPPSLPRWSCSGVCITAITPAAGVIAVVD